MALFKKAEMTSAYLKMGIYGEAGSGKTFTASQIAKGLSLLIASKNGGKKPPVMFLDTETGATWVRPIFEKDGIEFFSHGTRSFEDLKAAVLEAQAAGAILIVDSMTHFWEEIRLSYTAAKRERTGNEHAKLELPDWNEIKPAWGKFTSSYLNSRAHIILCGRAGSIYEFQEKEGSNRKEMISVGTRMAAEKGMGYEPSILVEMVQKQAVGRNKKKTILRTATVLKDRSDVLDGLQFDDPTFANFLPHIERLNLGGEHAGFDDSRNSEGLFAGEREGRDTSSIRREIEIEDIKELLLKHIPGLTAADKTRKGELVRKHFGGNWVELEKLMPLAQLKAGLISLRLELEPADTTSVLDDEIPEHAPAPQEAAPEPEIDDREVILHDFEIACMAFPGNSTRLAQTRKGWERTFEQGGFDPVWMAKVDLVVAKARKAKPAGLKAQLQTSVENERAVAAE